MVRLTIWTALFFLSVVSARVTLILLSGVHEMNMGLDSVVDPLLFSPEVLSLLRHIFPTLGGFGHLGVYDTVVCVSEAAFGVSKLVEPDGNITQSSIMRVRGLPEAVAQMTGHENPLRLPRTLDDAVLGIFFLALVAHLLPQCHLPDWLHEAIRQTPSPITDFFTLLQHLIPHPGLVPGFIFLLLPMGVYSVRWQLAMLRILPMEVLPFHQHAAAHLWLILFVLGLISCLDALAHEIHMDFMRWYAVYTVSHQQNAQEGPTRQTSEAA